jgi:hypothetical protein
MARTNNRLVEWKCFGCPKGVSSRTFVWSKLNEMDAQGRCSGKPVLLKRRFVATDDCIDIPPPFELLDIMSRKATCARSNDGLSRNSAMLQASQSHRNDVPILESKSSYHIIFRRRT